MKATSFISRQVVRETIEWPNRVFFILLDDWTWWAWSATVILLMIGLAGLRVAFLAAIAVTGIQFCAILIREKHLSAFPVQLRIAYLLLLAICFIPSMEWLYWLPTIGTAALVTFGYCPMARVLALLPWNRQEALSADLLLRTFLSRPDLTRLATDGENAGHAGGLCTIDAQIDRKEPAAIC